MVVELFVELLSLFGIKVDIEAIELLSFFILAQAFMISSIQIVFKLIFLFLIFRLNHKS